jgi:DICT domain-containing protein
MVFDSTRVIGAQRRWRWWHQKAERGDRVADDNAQLRFHWASRRGTRQATMQILRPGSAA